MGAGRRNRRPIHGAADSRGTSRWSSGTICCRPCARRATRGSPLSLPLTRPVWMQIPVLLFWRRNEQGSDLCLSPVLSYAPEWLPLDYLICAPTLDAAATCQCSITADTAIGSQALISMEATCIVSQASVVADMHRRKSSHDSLAFGRLALGPAAISRSPSQRGCEFGAVCGL